MPDQEKKKKIFFEMPSVSEFISKQAEETQKEYHDIVLELETRGYLNKPTGEKLSGEENMFAIRVIQTANIRVFYSYGNENIIFGLHGYVKKTQDIPKHELRQAKRVAKALKQRGVL